MGEGALRGAGRIVPEYWTDAPWRLEPGEKEIPLTFIARDAGGKTLRNIRVYRENGGNWTLAAEFEGPGKIDQPYWYYEPLPKIKLPAEFIPNPTWTSTGRHLRLKVEYKNENKTFYQQQLQVFVAKESLPLSNSPQWYYGDTHYHSNYTNDLKEFGNPVPDTKAAARCIGLEWMIITDHSVDLRDSNPYCCKGC
jgi:hypothetical protein